MADYYESGGVPPAPSYLRDVANKCIECGAVWVGPRRAACGGCADALRDGAYVREDGPIVSMLTKGENK